jgi:hypothetical protein
MSFLVGPEENNEKSFRITGVLTEIQTEDISKTSLGEDNGVLGCNALWLGSSRTFRKDISTPCSG